MRYSLLGLLRSPVFSAVAIVMLAAGLGGNLLIFSFANALLLKPLDLPHPDRLVHFLLLRPNNIPNTEFAYFDCRYLQQHAQSFDSVFASGDADLTLGAAGHNTVVLAQQVSGNFAQAAGFIAALGVPFTEADDEAGRYPLMLSYGLWQREFGGRPDVIGQTIRLRDAPFTIAAVLPPNFNGMDIDSAPGVYIPHWSVRRWVTRPVTLGVPVHIYARLKPGVSIDQARAEFERLYPEIVEGEIALAPETAPREVERQRATARAHRPWLEDASGGRSTLRTQFTLALRILLGAVGLLLLLVCANVGGLLLARSEARRHDLAVRLSLGATRLQAASIALWDTVILLAAGLAGALVLAHWGVPALLNMLPSRRPLALDPAIDWRVAGFAAGICLATALVTTVAPTLQVMRAGLTGMMDRGGSRVRRSRAAQVFIAIQIALATLLAIGGVVVAQSLHRLRHADPGFNSDHMIVAELNPRIASIVKPGEQEALIGSIIERAKTLPGVADVSFSLGALMRGIGIKNTIAPTGQRTAPNDLLNVSLNGVSPNYFENLGMHLVAGRLLTATDATAGKPRLVVVTSSFAKRFFPGLDPIGQRFGSGVNTVVGPDYEIVGVAADTKYRSMREEAPPTFFMVARHDDIDLAYGPTLYVRVHDNPARMMPELRRLFSDAGAPPTSLAPLEQEVEASVWRERILATLATSFAAIAALLSAAGLYGMLAHSVRRRTREIGIRMALGATIERIAGLVARDLMTCVLPGLIIGSLAYVACSRYLAPLLYGVGPVDGLLLAAGIAFIAVTALLAGIVPASRAIRVSPAEALRDQ